VLIGFEATGDYHRGLAYRLLSAGFELRLVCPWRSPGHGRRCTMAGDKNDPKDAQVILHMLRIGATQHYVDPLAAGINDLQELSKTHEVISKAKTETWHRILTHYLPLYFPEIERDLHQRQQQDRSARPVEQKHQGTRELGREDGAGRKAAPEMVLRLHEKNDGQGDLHAECPRGSETNRVRTQRLGSANIRWNMGVLGSKRHRAGAADRLEVQLPRPATAWAQSHLLSTQRSATSFGSIV
jgi:hypothetical protein